MFPIPIQLKDLLLFLIKLIDMFFFCIQRGRKPLLSAIDSGHSDLAQLLIKEGAFIDVTHRVS